MASFVAPAAIPWQAAVVAAANAKRGLGAARAGRWRRGLGAADSILYGRNDMLPGAPEREPLQ
jgi:hypothetical protein